MTATAGPWSRPGNGAVAVLGSINRDLLLRVPHLPQDGETLHTTAWQAKLGGKGANQAVAASRCGAPVALFGAVGADLDGRDLISGLRGAGVMVDDVASDPKLRTGTAVVVVDDAGRNLIMLTAGANESVSDAYVAAVWPQLAKASVLVLQGELPVAVNRAAIRRAEEIGMRVIVNLAPYQDLGELTDLADPLVVNEIEASELCERPIDSVTAGIGAASALATRTRSVVITLGAMGAVVAAGDRVRHIPAPPLETVVDTTGAGDAVVGVLAAGLVAGSDLLVAAGLGVRAGSLVVQHVGAGLAYPDFRSLLSDGDLA